MVAINPDSNRIDSNSFRAPNLQQAKETKGSEKSVFQDPVPDPTCPQNPTCPQEPTQCELPQFDSDIADALDEVEKDFSDSCSDIEDLPDMPDDEVPDDSDIEREIIEDKSDESDIDEHFKEGDEDITYRTEVPDDSMSADKPELDIISPTEVPNNEIKPELDTISLTEVPNDETDEESDEKEF